MKRAILVLVIIVVIGAGAGAWYFRRGGAEVSVETAPLSRGDVVESVGATGTLQAVTTVQVGTQVSGTISWLGADFNSIVTRGQVIARLDPSLFEAQLQQTRANLTQSQANLAKAESELGRTKIQLADAQQKFTRAKELASRNLLAQSELDSAKVTLDSAEAAVQSQQATVTQVRAAVRQSEASVNQSQVNLDHTVISAPIDGIVIQRNVDVGQTVAASMQAPTLFVIAADLREMQVNASVDEADVGRIRPGQHVTFRVDAYATDTFTGTVTQVRLQPVVVQNVTTYGTVIAVPNTELKLKPGMTANVRIEIARRTNVLRVPNAALRFRPTEEMFAAFNQTPPPELSGGFGRGGRAGTAGSAGSPGSPGSPGSTGSAAPAPLAAGRAPTGPAQAERQASNATAGGAGPEATGRGARAGGLPGGGRGGFGGEFAGGARGGGDIQARMLERLKTMPPEEQQQFLARMKERGADTSALEAALPKPAGPPSAAPRPGSAQQAQTIDALFAPLPPTESRGRVWLFVDRQLKLVNVRLGITDGTYTELLSGELPETAELVTNVTGLGATRTQPRPGGTGNPLMPGRGGPGGFGGPGGGRGGRG
jgi:HlyD family secretion protein